MATIAGCGGITRLLLVVAVLSLGSTCAAEDPPTSNFHLRQGSGGQDGGQVFPKPYSPPCVERENVFEFTEKPAVKSLGNDKYEITFAVRGNCDVTVGVVDEKGVVVRHLGAGVLGANAPAPFQRNSLRQRIYWNGKDDFDVYHKTPEKLKVRAMLGLKPEFDKRLGGTSPYNIPGYIWGLAADEGGVYAFIKGGRGRLYIRKFDHDGKYLQSLVPPPPDLPESRLAGMGYVEYEPGKKAVHNPQIGKSTAIEGYYLAYSGKQVDNCQLAVSGGRMFYSNSGEGAPSLLYSVGMDGSTTLEGCAGLPLLDKMEFGVHKSPHLAASPDGKWLYFADAGGDDNRVSTYVVWRRAVGGNETAKPFAGEFKKPGSDNQHLLSPRGIDCDPQGRLYVCDNMNRRVQIYSPDGKHLKSIEVDRPELVRVHQKDGSVYVLHEARVEGKTVARITKFSSFDTLKELHHQDGFVAAIMALDSWGSKPRLWIGGGLKDGMDYRFRDSYHSFRVMEDTGSGLRKIVDFEEEARREAGGNYFGRWPGGSKQLVIADPTNERIYYLNQLVFDLRTGKLAAIVHLPGSTDDIAVDKRGYVHCHFNPGFYQQGVARMDPGQATAFKSWDTNPAFPNLRFKEVPYDYGVEAKDGFTGVLPVKDQPGAKFFQDGIGVNMRGDIAVQSNIYYAPKMEDEAKHFATTAANTDEGGTSGGGVTYEMFLRDLTDKMKRGEEVYSIRRQPGVPTVGATIWTFDHIGELRDECAVTFGALMNGVQIDEVGGLYFVGNRPKWVNGKSFLAGRGGTFGLPDAKENRDPFMGALLKTRGKSVKALLPRAPVAMDELPERSPELVGNDWGFGDGRCWVEGAEWVYGGACPIVWPMNCSCPTLRFSTDWYKRSFVPEAYRHSIGIVDTAGNLIMHQGQYGNFDAEPGVGMVEPRCIAATDNYLVYDDWGERLVVLRLNYHAEETVGIGEVMSAK